MTNHASVDQPPPPTEANQVNAAAPARPAGLKLKIFWSLAGILGAISCGLVGSRVSVARSTCSGDYCFDWWSGWIIGYVCGMVIASMIGSWATFAEGDGYRRNHYAQNGAMALPGAIFVALFVFIVLYSLLG